VAEAASAGIAAYARGGNAFDAALAACFVETVALPMKCGLAGDVIALYRQRGGPVRALLSVGGAPLAVDAGRQLTRVGPLSVGVPGAPAGYAALHAMAQLDLPTLIAPAVAAADHGVPWSRVGLSYLTEARALLERWSPQCVYLAAPEPQPGDLLQLPGLGRMLEAFAHEGAALFHGGHGESLIQALDGLGGLLTLQDLRAHQVQHGDPVTLSMGEATLYATPGPTQGPQLLEVMRRWLAQPEASAARRLRSDACAWDDSLLAGIVAQVRTEARTAGRLPSDDGTSVVSAADEWGNAVVVVHSNSFPRFGSGVVLENGLVLNNRPGRGFDAAAAPGARASAAGGKVPPTTLQAWALLDAGAATFGATPGGVNQLVWNSQTLASLLAGARPERVVTEPRWAVDDQGAYSAEADITLDAVGVTVRPVAALGLRSAQQIMHVDVAGRVAAFADPRAGGTAMALP
jgi:gamma-glutamyltranspeptidase/glutathione hydrolase